MQAIQKSFNKWFPRALEMFGDERGGDTNVKFGFKDMKNREAQDLYIEEVRRMVRDINHALPARALPVRLSRAGGARSRTTSSAITGATTESRGTICCACRTAASSAARAKPAWTMVGVDGEVFDEADTYLRYLSTLLSDGYMASRDLKLYAEGLRKVVAGEWTPQDATKRLPKLRRVGGTCPCSRAVRWVVDEPAASAS